jgi:hypothetical protein
VAQWNTASFGPDYRLPPLQSVIETFTWSVPEAAPGELQLTATVYYSLIVQSVADYLKVPAEEYEAVVMGEATAVVTVR